MDNRLLLILMAVSLTVLIYSSADIMKDEETPASASIAGNEKAMPRRNVAADDFDGDISDKLSEFVDPFDTQKNEAVRSVETQIHPPLLSAPQVGANRESAGAKVGLSLKGVALGDEKIAIISDGKKTIALSEGEYFDRYKVVSIESESVILADGVEEVTLFLFWGE